MMYKKDSKKTAWSGKVGKWYKTLVGKEGSFYHQKIVIPGALRLLNLKKEEKLLEFGCGQGILGRQIVNEYMGLDLSPELITEAKNFDKNEKHYYWVGDVCQPVKLHKTYEKGAIILSLQNFKKPYIAIKNMSMWLKDKGELILIINHPAFRIPQHSDWIVKDGKQWRIESIYMSHEEIEIKSSPFDRKNNQKSFSYHWSISAISEMLLDNGFIISKIEEWVSPKKSEGKMARIEDKARQEFPLFMAVVAKKYE